MSSLPYLFVVMVALTMASSAIVGMEGILAAIVRHAD
jgi:hypothetical protein